MEVKIPFKITYGKFKEIKGFDNEVEDVEGCDMCLEGKDDGELWKQKCVYLNNDKLEFYLQICEKCFKKIKKLRIK